VTVTHRRHIVNQHTYLTEQGCPAMARCYHRHPLLDRNCWPIIPAWWDMAESNGQLYAPASLSLWSSQLLHRDIQHGNAASHTVVRYYILSIKLWALALMIPPVSHVAIGAGYPLFVHNLTSH